MIYGSIFHNSLDLYQEVAGYEQMTHCLHALQLILREKANSTIAQHIAVAGIYLLQEAVVAMPDDVAEGWANYAQLGAEVLRQKLRGINAE